jgi:polysaccharide export outer membrane protein
MHRRFVTVILFALLSACATGASLRGGPDVTVVDAAALPAPSRSDIVGENRAYLIGPFDKLSIDVFGVDELSKKMVQIDAGGDVSFPLVGTLKAAGKTPNELAKEIGDRLRSAFVRNPQVTVNLEETISQVVAVDGEVQEPGLYPVVGRMTLLRAVAKARGTTEFAKLSDVVIFRRVAGQQMAALYNLKLIRDGVYQDPEIFANDVVVVGNSRARRIFRDILQASPILSAPLVAILNNRN